jgi:hypothetical protein
MTNANFDIYKIINGASTKDKVAIYCDDLLNGCILYERKFDDEQLNALVESFKNNTEIHYFNTTIQRCTYILLLIADIEKEILQAEFIMAHLRFYMVSDDDKLMVDAFISRAADNLKGIVSDKKELKKVFKNLSSMIGEMCFLSFSDKAIERFIGKVSNIDNKENLGDKLIQYFVKQISYRIEVATGFIDLLKKSYENFDIKFEVIDCRIKKFEDKMRILKESVLKY